MILFTDYKKRISSQKLVLAGTKREPNQSLVQPLVLYRRGLSYIYLSHLAVQFDDSIYVHYTTGSVNMSASAAPECNEVKEYASY